MPVIIRLTRSEKKEEDDIITIRSRWGIPGFIVRYVDGKSPRCVWVSDKTFNEVLDYVSRIFAGLNDIDPFKGVQLDIPGYPLVYHRVSDITPDVEQRVLETIRDWLLSPPSSFFE
jgi:hypothetical protein